MNGDSFLGKHGLNIEADEVKIGETYPVYGMMTDIICDTPGEVVVKLNYNITARLNLSTEEKVELIKSRAFDPGIFVSTILEQDAEQTIIDCHTVVFGKKNTYDA